MVFDIVIFIAIVLLGLSFPQILNIQRKDRIRLNWLWVYHLLFTFIFYYFILSIGGSDSLKYWDGAKVFSGNQALVSLIENKGTRAMYAINYIPSNIFDLSFFSGTMIYSIFGFMGLAYFYKVAIETISFNYRISNILLFPTILYLPNLHFWSVGIGKDTLLFYTIGLFGYSMLKIKSRMGLIAISLLLSYIVRPHIALFLLLSFSLAFLLESKISTIKRGFLFLLLMGFGALMLPSVLEYTQVEEISVESYEQFSSKKVKNLSKAHTGSSVDISNYPLPIKVFTFLFRPTFTDINNPTALIAAIENLILLILFIFVLIWQPVETFNNAPFIIKGLVIFLAIGTIAFSMSLGNLGIMLRMRNMFLPGMLILICYSFSYHNRNRYIRTTKKR